MTARLSLLMLGAALLASIGVELLYHPAHSAFGWIEFPGGWAAVATVVTAGIWLLGWLAGALLRRSPAYYNGSATHRLTGAAGENEDG